jgi:hypothetical protein
VFNAKGVFRHDWFLLQSRRKQARHRRRQPLGLNGARVYGVDVPERRRKTAADPIGTRKQAYRKRADPTFETYGPKTDSEYDALIAERGGLPA